MTSRQLLLQAKEKQDFDDRINNYKNKKKGKKGDTDKVLEEEHERFVKYVQPFNEKNVPISDSEMRNHIKESFREKKDLDFLVANSNNSAYDNLIDELQRSKEYNDALAKMKQDIKIKRKLRGKERTRKGIPLNDKYYFIIVKAHKTKSGTRVSSHRRYYSTTTGKQVQTGKLMKYIEVRQTQPTEIRKIHRIELIRKESMNRQIKIKEKAKLQLLLEKKREREKINRLKSRK